MDNYNCLVIMVLWGLAKVGTCIEVNHTNYGDFLPTDTTEIRQAGPSTRKAIEEPPTTEKEQVGRFLSGSSADKENPHTCSDRCEDVTVSIHTVSVAGTPAKKVKFNMDDKATPACS
ncbi:hypothetical protein QYM36_014225 [Artemia franciscana]|uniref:Secreted protein n=1 Tax=Artemia franciscana TaxID=6661 RepID=A0AA88HG84_ARTSF|nr:hypothetical protein QYM36_014225 [Artemia franciscana]